MNDQTAEILNRFNESWTSTEILFDNLINNYPGFERLKPLRQFISLLKENHGNMNFRLGTSIHKLIISRSVDFELRSDQKYIMIDTININEYEVTLRDGKKLYRQYRLNNLEDNQLKKLLETLKNTLVD